MDIQLGVLRLNNLESQVSISCHSQKSSPFHPFTQPSRHDPFLHRALKFHASNRLLCFHLQPGEFFGVGQECDCTEILLLTLQGTNIAHVGKRRMVFTRFHKYLWEGIC